MTGTISILLEVYSFANIGRRKYAKG
jgi:hypothetical protein